MLPTLHSSQDICWIDLLSKRWRTWKFGDIVVFVSLQDPDKLICKRIIGLVSKCVVFFFKKKIINNKYMDKDCIKN